MALVNRRVLVNSDSSVVSAALCNDISSMMNKAVALQEEDEQLRTQAERNATTRELLRVQQLSLWGAHSMLSDWLNDQSVNPLSTYIRLTCDLQQRRQTLAAIKPRMLGDAQQFLLTRTHFLDVLKPYYMEDRCENARGDYCATRFDIIQFEDVQSVKQVFDALVTYMVYMEMSISEKLGDVTVREDCDLQDADIMNNRFLSTNRHGVTIEMNRAVFAHFEHSQVHPDQDIAITTADFVNEDELWPYSPGTRLRKDITGAVMLTAHRREGELVVVMRRAGFLKLHRPEIAMAKPLLREEQEKISGWGEVMIKAMRDQLYPGMGLNL